MEFDRDGAILPAQMTFEGVTEAITNDSISMHIKITVVCYHFVHCEWERFV
jgi:hypothetical protein